jgi:hypothetical protein
MTNKKENQSQNLENNKKNEPVKIIEAFLAFHTALADINSAFEDFVEQTNINAANLRKLQNRLLPGGSIWRLENIERELSTILLAAALSGKPQYLQFENYVVEISKPKDRADPVT